MPQIPDKSPEPPAWRCPECEKHRGVSVRSMLHPVLIGGSVDQDGYVTGGEWMMACFHCMARGKMTIAGRATVG